MTKQNINSKKGFTIIEVVLVLAIAGLIFLMVFVALPALQRSQRDTARRNDMARVSTSLVQYQTNNSSAASSLPVGPFYYEAKPTFGADCQNSSACMFLQRYLNSGSDSTNNNFKDPSGDYYNIYISANIAEGAEGSGASQAASAQVAYNPSSKKYTVKTDFDKHTIHIMPGGKCDGEDVVISGKNNYAVLYRLEGAGVYCIDDQ